MALDLLPIIIIFTLDSNTYAAQHLAHGSAACQGSETGWRLSTAPYDSFWSSIRASSFFTASILSLLADA